METARRAAFPNKGLHAVYELSYDETIQEFQQVG